MTTHGAGDERQPGKHPSLAERLGKAGGDSATLTFAEIDELVGGLPARARASSWWWANDEAGHPWAQCWLDAGFRVSAVELDNYVTFQGLRGRILALEVVSVGETGPVVTGRLDVRDSGVVADAGAAWLLADSFAAVLPDGAHANRVAPSQGEPFLVACWFSLRDIDRWGRLIGPGGRVLTRAEGFALVDACSGVGVLDMSDQVADLDGSWTGVPARVPGRTWDLDVAMVAFEPQGHLLDPSVDRAAGYAYPGRLTQRRTGPRPRATRPADTAWIDSQEVDPACARRGMRVWDSWWGAGTVLAVEPGLRKTALLVAYDNGDEGWAPFIGVEFADGPDLVRRGPDTRW